MTTEPSLRDRAIDALGQALNDSRYWLPVEGRPVAVDAVLNLVSQPAEHCGAILPSIWEQPPTECVLRPDHQGSHANHDGARWIEKQAAGYCPHCGRGDAAPTADEYEASRRRAALFQARLDAARDWARNHLEPQQQDELLAILGGRDSTATEQPALS